jgi:type IV secretory pathway VirB10-like protein
MKDLLEEAAGALREEGTSDDAAHRFTRARVMASLHQSTVKRRTRLAFLLPIAATFLATSAWGVSSGRARVWVEEIRTAIGFSTSEKAPPPEPAKGPKRAVAARAPDPAPVVEAAPAPPVVEEPPPVVEEAPKAAPEPAGSQASAAPDAGLDAELELYRAAHRAHFGGGDPASALAAWDAYLKKSPKGRFALEARYNRALCLVRLARNAEARAALEPFAKGSFGGYRKREAGELLEALGR